MADVKKIIYDRRKALGLTLKDVAKACGVSEGTVSRWESGDIDQMKRSRIVILARVLQVSPLAIMGMEEPEEITGQAFITDSEKMLLEAFRASPRDIQLAVLRVLGVQPPEADALDGA